jgi:hypothetical protein
MSDHDMIRRGDALAAAKGFIGAETAITAIPAADPLADPRVQALVEALRFVVSAKGLTDPTEYGYEAIKQARATLAEIEGSNDP